MDPRISEIFKRQTYDTSSLQTRGGDRVRWIATVFKVSPPDLAERRILEIGCGSGEVTGTLKALGADAIGVDLGDNFRRGPYKELDCFHQMDAASDELLGLGQFDYIVSFDCLEHMEQPDKLISRLPQLLKQGGQAFLKFNLYRGPSASHITSHIAVPWLHLIYSDAEIRDMMFRKTGKSRGSAWVNKLTHLHYLELFNNTGLELRSVTYRTVKMDPDLYEQHREKLKAYPLSDLEKDFMQVHCAAA